MARTPLLTLRLLAAAAAVVSAPLAALADPPAATGPSPQEQAIQGLDLVMKGLRGMIEQVPLYGPPEVLPNGDIILRRLSPAAPQPPAPAPSIAPVPAQRM